MRKTWTLRYSGVNTDNNKADGGPEPFDSEEAARRHWREISSPSNAIRGFRYDFAVIIPPDGGNEIYLLGKPPRR